ncbi:MAG: DUF4476 domain-containing protein [Dysgonamonadaceae bacterium]|jgi:hypothetical protein|nr:DUF4476 domain-containing protein [Dysgonamonadaceae bacterium]
MRTEINYAIALRQIIVLLLLVGAGSCSSLYKGRSALMRVEKGMSKDEVGKLLGTPDYRRFNDELEEWEYRRMITGGDAVVIVYFSGGRVAGMDSFEDNAPCIMELQTPPMPPRPQTPIYTRGMPEPEFANLLAKIKNEAFKDNQFALLKLAAEKKSFACNQCVGLMSIFPFDDDKLNVVRILAPQLADKENYGAIINALSFLSSEEKARRILGVPAK